VGVQFYSPDLMGFIESIHSERTRRAQAGHPISAAVQVIEPITPSSR
jgi:hypothetical protein